MPFAGYKNFDDCVRRNRNKRDPKAYCASIKHQVEGKKMQKFKRFIPIKKIDKDQRMVYGFASTPDLDSDGEIITLEAMKNALPDYLKFPTIREMHQPKAIGRTKTAEVVDNPKLGKGLWIGAKIVADDAWKLVKEGVLTAFSIAGDVVKRANNVIEAFDLVEISLVDVPANKAATIQVWKRDFNTAQRKRLAREGKAMPDGSFPIVNRQDLRNAIQAFGRAKNKAAAKRHIIKRARALGAVGLLPESWNVHKILKIANALAVLSKSSQAKEVKKMKPKKLKKAKKAKPVKKAKKVVNKKKKAGSADSSLQKANKILKKLSKKKAVLSKVSLQKTINGMAGTIETMASVMQEQEKRIVKLENTPAAVKSKAAFVYKNKEQKKVTKKSSGKRIAQIKERLEKLASLKEKLGPNEFARQGYPKEAGRLMTERERLS